MSGSNLLYLSFGLIFGCIFGSIATENSMKIEAIKNKVAEYQLDKTTGKVTFQYITPCKTP